MESIPILGCLGDVEMRQAGWFQDVTVLLLSVVKFEAPSSIHTAFRDHSRNSFRICVSHIFGETATLPAQSRRAHHWCTQRNCCLMLFNGVCTTQKQHSWCFLHKAFPRCVGFVLSRASNGFHVIWNHPTTRLAALHPFWSLTVDPSQLNGCAPTVGKMLRSF